MKKNSHAPEITTHITEEHSKPNVFVYNGTTGVHPKVKEGCYANAEGSDSSHKD